MSTHLLSNPFTPTSSARKSKRTHKLSVYKEKPRRHLPEKRLLLPARRAMERKHEA
jgi:hypothetical protein